MIKKAKQSMFSVQVTCLRFLSGPVLSLLQRFPGSSRQPLGGFLVPVTRTVSLVIHSKFEFCLALQVRACKT